MGMAKTDLEELYKTQETVKHHRRNCTRQKKQLNTSKGTEDRLKDTTEITKVTLRTDSKQSQEQIRQSQQTQEKRNRT